MDLALQILLSGMFAFTCLLAYYFNKDLFSPVKLYLLTILICFFDIFVAPYRLEICIIYMLLLAVGALLARFETLAITQKPKRYRPVPEQRAVVMLWLLTLIPIASMAFLVYYFGGIDRYLAQLPSRSLSFRGLNTFSEIAINLASLFTVVYFGIGVTRKRSISWWSLYSAHFCIAFIILAGSGSRRYLLMAILMMIALVHYLRSPISIRAAAVFLAVVLAITSVAAVLRLSQRDFNSIGRELNSDERESLTAHFEYGLVPFQVIYGANVLELHYGSTFVAAVTNIIPRPLWPNKPDGAGPAITKDYLGDRWLGASNLNANFIVESIMNFGFPIGLPFGFAGLTLGMSWLVGRYRRIVASSRAKDHSLGAILALVRQFQFALAITGLVTWETAVVTVPLFLNLGALWMIGRLIGTSARTHYAPRGISFTGAR